MKKVNFNPVKDFFKKVLPYSLSGVTTAASFQLMAIIFGRDVSPYEASLYLITPLIGSYISSINYSVEKKISLIIASYCCLALPISGASFGAPDNKISTRMKIVLFGLVGGIFWGTSFELVKIIIQAHLNLIKKSSINNYFA